MTLQQHCMCKCYFIMKSCLLNTVCMLLPYLCLQCCSLVGPNGKDSTEQVQCSVHKTNDLKSYDILPLTTASECEDMHCWGDKIKEDERGMSYTCGRRGFGGESCRTQFRRPRNRWDSNIKMELKEMGCEVVDWINLAHDRTSGWLLCTEQWTFAFHKTQEISWLPAKNYELHGKECAACSYTAQVGTQITKATNGPHLQPA